MAGYRRARSGARHREERLKRKKKGVKNKRKLKRQTVKADVKMRVTEFQTLSVVSELECVYVCGIKGGRERESERGRETEREISVRV